jgi:hypothetical protein
MSAFIFFFEAVLTIFFITFVHVQFFV